MALVQKTKYIVWNENWTGLAFKEASDPTIDDFDFALPIVFEEKDVTRGAERLPGVAIKAGRGVRTTI